MANPLISNVGSLIKTVPGSTPRAASAGATNGAAVDRLGYGSLVLATATGAATGSPSAVGVAAKLQDSADGSTGWADVSGAALALAAENASGKVNVDLAGVKRYVRVVETVALTGGSTPTLALASTVVLGGADTLPAV